MKINGLEETGEGVAVEETERLREPQEGGEEVGRGKGARLVSNNDLRGIVGAFPHGRSRQGSGNVGGSVGGSVGGAPTIVDLAFGYGSGVLSQRTAATTEERNGEGLRQRQRPPPSPMIDLIFVVRDPLSWHRANLLLHPDHYPPWIRALDRLSGATKASDFSVAASMANFIQTDVGAGMYFHPYVDDPRDDSGDGDGGGDNEDSYTHTHPHPQLKYGVISTADAMRDLNEWEWLYLAGRMHKPIVGIDGEGEGGATMFGDALAKAAAANRLAAASAALLLLGGGEGVEGGGGDEHAGAFVPLPDLCETIAGLSYGGDFRNKIGAEDPDKVSKLVGGGSGTTTDPGGLPALWRDAYKPALKILESEGLIEVYDADANATAAERRDVGRCFRGLEWDPRDATVREALVKHLPPRMRRFSDDIVGVGGNGRTTTVAFGRGSLFLRHELARIVGPAARSQGMKGLLTAGLTKSVRYAAAKFAKGAMKK